LAISAANVQQAVDTIDRAPSAIEEASMQYLQAIGAINTQVTQASSVVSGAGTDPSFTAMVQQATVNVSNIPSIINSAKTQINSSLDQVQGSVEQLNIALQSMQAVQQTAQNTAPNSQQAADAGPLIASGAFNWKKAQLANDQMQSPMSEFAADDFGPFNDTSDLLQKLEGMDRVDAENKLLSYISDPEGQEVCRKTMEIVFEYEIGPQERLEAMSQVWDYLPDALKISSEQLTSIEGDYVNNQEQQTMANLENIKKIVEASNEEVRKLAQKESAKSYNFKKQAQHKSYENVILWGPESRNNVDPFTGQPTSDWHVFERNKGWNWRIGDRWDIDFEAFWRGNIMDKYSRPYRDADGNWVGGYIEKRFEVDRWQPEENTYMLKPGEKRKPRPAELGNYEARMEAYRGNKDGVYNWTEASGKKRIKTAQEVRVREHKTPEEIAKTLYYDTEDAPLSVKKMWYTKPGRPRQELDAITLSLLEQSPYFNSEDVERLKPQLPAITQNIINLMQDDTSSIRANSKKMIKTSNLGLEQVEPDEWRYKGYVIRKDKFVGYQFQSEDFDGTPEFSEDDQPWDKRYGSSPTLEGAVNEIDDMVQNDPNNFVDRMASSKKKRM